jgi:regulatory protein
MLARKGYQPSQAFRIVGEVLASHSDQAGVDIPEDDLFDE